MKVGKQTADDDKRSKWCIWQLLCIWWDVFFTTDKVHIESQLIRVIYDDVQAFTQVSI